VVAGYFRRASQIGDGAGDIEDALFALTLKKPAGTPGAWRLVQTSVKPKHALTR
jgi:hypothetical protein